QTAYEMCAGLLSTGDCGAAIATTGLAGPKSDESGLPVGLCFLAAGAEGKIYIARHIFSGTREEITEQAVNHALFWAYKHLK
ncbi:MAG: CinA family protein, partial [Candidatus Scatosoma sp.]